MKYDYLIVGAGLYGSMFAHMATIHGMKCLVIEKEDHVGGMCYTENIHGIDVHKYGAHIFHTNRKDIWDFVNSIDPFFPFINSPLANYQGKLYHLPFNMNTFYELWGIKSPEQAKKKIAANVIPCSQPKNLEEQAMSMVGKEIYEKFIKGYTEKQWGRPCTELPASIIKRIPLRFTFDNNYFKDIYQGIPKHSYTFFIQKLLSGSTLKLCVNYLNHKSELDDMAEKVIYTGPIDKLYGYSFGTLDYRKVGFKHKYYPDTDDRQGNAVINYTASDIPFTRSIEHKHFSRLTEAKGTIVTREYPNAPFGTPAYPINDARNNALYSQYRKLATLHNPKIIFGGRLAEYKYYDMNQIIENIYDMWR